MSAHMMKSVAWVVGLLAMGVAGPVQAATITYFHNDFAGSPIAATDASGQVIWRESYRPYGERLTNVATSSANKLWFTSRRQDAESGLVYMGARYYDPVIGRFMSTDPVQFQEGNLHSFNRYAYANNNPYRYTDPDGRNPILIAMGVGALINGGLNAAVQYYSTGTIQWGGLGGVIDAAGDGMLLGLGGVRGASSTVLAETAGLGTANANKLQHVFGKAEHGLEPLVKAAGSREKAYQSVQEAANKAFQEGRLRPNEQGVLPGGNGGAILEVSGVNVQMVGGRVVNGEVKIGTFSRRDLND